MKIVLLQLALSDGITPGFNEHEEPLGLCYVGAAASQAGFDVRIVQQVSETDAAILNRIVALEPDVLGVTAVTATAGRAAQLAGNAKNSLEELITVIGGSHACADPHGCAELFDFVVVGEGEDVFVSLLGALQEGCAPSNVPGLCYRDKAGVVLSGYPLRRKELDGLMPLRDGLDLGAYDPCGSPPVPHATTGFAAMITSRGCPHQCAFCCNGSIWRDGRTGLPYAAFRSPADVLREVVNLRDAHGVNYIVIEDTDFLARPKASLHELLHLLKTNGLGTKWACLARPDRILPHWPATAADVDDARVLLQQMRNAGCHMICLGVESGDDQLRQSMDRHFTNEQMLAVFELIFEAQIASTAFLVLGFPGETPASLGNTRRLIKDIEATRIRAGFFYPFGNIPCLDDHDIRWIRPELASPDHATTEEPTVVSGVSPEELIQFRHNLCKEFYGSHAYSVRMKTMEGWSPFWEKTIEGWLVQLAASVAAREDTLLCLTAKDAPYRRNSWNSPSMSLMA